MRPQRFPIHPNVHETTPLIEWAPTTDIKYLIHLSSEFDSVLKFVRLTKIIIHCVESISSLYSVQIYSKIQFPFPIYILIHIHSTEYILNVC